MPSSLRFVQQSVTIDAVTRTPISLQGGVTRAVIRNTDTVNDCTIYDRDSAGSGVVLAAGRELVIDWPSPVGENTEILCWATAAAGTGPLTVRTT